jgi:acyl transferase domain-containing protein
VFLLPGQGAEAAGMSADPYERYPSFRADLDRGAEFLRDLLGVDPRDVLVGGDPGGLVHHTDITQPVLLLHCYALGRLLMSWGVRPSALVGHSVGELTAACLAGELDLTDALRLVATRGRLMQEAPEGGMLVVLAPLAEVAALLVELAELDVAAVNAPEVTVVAGPVAPLTALRERLDAAGVAHRPMPAGRAFHSRMMARAAAELATVPVTHRARTVDVISSVSGAVLPRGQVRDAGYWPEQLRSPVRFLDAVRTAVAAGPVVFVEVGPGTALTGTTRQIPEAAGAATVALQPRRSGVRDLAAAAGMLWSLGVAVDWVALRDGRPVARVPLPTYPFARTRHWLDVTPAAPAETSEPVPAEESVLDEVVELWRSMLGNPEIDADTSFFVAGGESLLLIRMASRVQKKFGVTVSVGDLSSAPTARMLAAQVMEARA